jgi:hypothetical protein
LPIRRNEVVLPATARMNLVKKKKWKKPIVKKNHILDDSIEMKYPEKVNL